MAVVILNRNKDNLTKIMFSVLCWVTYSKPYYYFEQLGVSKIWGWCQNIFGLNISRRLVYNPALSISLNQRYYTPTVRDNKWTIYTKNMNFIHTKLQRRIYILCIKLSIYHLGNLNPKLAC